VWAMRCAKIMEPVRLIFESIVYGRAVDIDESHPYTQLSISSFFELAYKPSEQHTSARNISALTI